MTWNYRVFREEHGVHVIREVYYNEDGSIATCTENAVEPMGDSFDELAADLLHFQRALSLPVLTLADIPEGKPFDLDRGETISHEALMEKLGLRSSCSGSANTPEDEVLPEYEFDYSRAKPSRFASATGE
jgi:hypothetical protein